MSLNRMNAVEAGLAVWHRTRPAEDSIVQTYLQSRGIECEIPGIVRALDELEHPSGGVWPAMIALVTRGLDGEAIGVHATFLNRDGRNRAPIVPQTIMLGPCRGGVVQFAEPP